MGHILSEIASLIGAEVASDTAGVMIESLAPIAEAGSGQMTFFANSSYEKYLPQCKATAILVSNDPRFDTVEHTAIFLKVGDPYAAFAKVIALFDERPSIFTERIHPSAVISPEATIALSAMIGAHVFIASGVEIGEGTAIHPNCTIYDGVKIGKHCVIGPGSVIGFDGFGYAQQPDGSYEKIPQIGTVIIEDEVEIGANCTIDRAALSATIIHTGTKIDNLVHIAHNVEVGEHTAIAAQAGISGSAIIGKKNQIAGQVGMVGHITTAENVVIIAQSGVSKSIAKPGVYQGSPAKEVRSAFKQEAAIRMLPELLERVRVLEQKLRETKA